MQRYGCSQPTVQQAEVLRVITIVAWPGSKEVLFCKAEHCSASQRC